MTDKKNDLVEYLKGFSCSEDRARVIRAAGLESFPDSELQAYIDSQAALAAGHEGKVLVSTRGTAPKTKNMIRADKRAQKRYDRARARPGFERAYGDASLSPAALAAKSAASTVKPSGHCGPVATPGNQLPAVDPIASPKMTNANDTPPRRVYIDPFQGPMKPPPVGSFEEAIGHLIEAQMSRKPGSAVLPAAIVGTNSPNPFQAPARPSRSSALKASEAWRLFDANSFLMWRYGETMTAHVIILWETYRVHDHQDAARLLGLLLNKAWKWAARGKPNTSRVRRAPRDGLGFDLKWIYVHEHVGPRGFHSHILLNLPRMAAPAFEKWLDNALTTQTGCPGDRRSLRVVVSRAGHQRAAIHRGWSWLRYLCKELEQGAEISVPGEAPRHLRTVLRLWSSRGALPVTCKKMSGVSESLGPTARKAAGFRSTLTYGDPDDLFSGKELEQFEGNKLLEEMLPSLAI